MATPPIDLVPTPVPVTSPPVAPEPRAERRAATVLLAAVGLFQVALAAGAPWGAAAWSGSHPGTLPESLRVASAVSAAVYGGLAAVVGTDILGATTRRTVLTGASALLTLGTVMNLVSPSPVEKLWAPVAAALAVLLWRSRPPVSR